MPAELQNQLSMQQVALTADEQQIVERLRMTPEDRIAEQDAQRQAWLDSMSADQRQAQEARDAKLAAMTPTQRQSFFLGRQLADLSRLLRRAADNGLPVAQVVADQEQPDADTIAWLTGELNNIGAA